jgi:hypothetical protein
MRLRNRLSTRIHEQRSRRTVATPGALEAPPPPTPTPLAQPLRQFAPPPELTLMGLLQNWGVLGQQPPPTQVPPPPLGLLSGLAAEPNGNPYGLDDINVPMASHRMAGPAPIAARPQSVAAAPLPVKPYRKVGR